jgi:hypothetical protein
MSTNVTWNGTTYSIPASDEVNWASLSSFLIALGNNAATTEESKHAIRIATTSPVTVDAATDYAVIVDRTVAGATTVNLPAGVAGQIFVIVDGKGDAGTNNITISPNGAQTIAGSSSLVLNKNRQAVWLQYSTTGTDWKILGLINPPLPTTTKGDLIVNNGTADVRLPVGTNGYSIVADSTEANGLKWSPAGGGSGEINLVDNPNDAATWVASGSGVTVATTTSSSDLPLFGVIDTAIKITPVSGTDYVRTRFTMPASLKSYKLKVEWFQRPLSGYTSGDFKLEVYSNSASDYSGSYTEFSLDTDISGTTAIPNTNGRYTSTFQADTSDYYEIRIVRTAGTTALNICNFICGPGIPLASATNLNTSFWYDFSSWNPSGTGSVSTDPTAGTVQISSPHITASAVSSGTTTFTFNKVGTYIAYFTVGHTHANAYTSFSFTGTMGGTTTRYGTPNLSGLATGQDPADSNEVDAFSMTVVVSTIGQTLTWRPLGNSNGISSTAQHSFYASVGFTPLDNIGQAYGFSQATATATGLVKGGTVPGSTTGTSTAAGYIGELLTAENTGQSISGAGAQDMPSSSVTLTAGIWLCNATVVSDGTGSAFTLACYWKINGSQDSQSARSFIQAGWNNTRGTLSLPTRIINISSSQDLRVRVDVNAVTQTLSCYLTAVRIG